MMKLHDDELDEQRPNQDALLKQLAGPPMLPGGTAQGFAQGEPTPGALPAPPKPDYSGWGQYGVEGLDKAKIDAGHDSPKYQIGRIQSHFDPTKGVTPEMIDALNGLTYQGQKMGNFRFDPKATSNDWLYVDDGVSKFDGVKGGDIVRNSGPGGAWQGWGGSYGLGPDGGSLPEPAQGGGQGGGMGLGMAQGGLHSLLSGDPMAGIQAAIGKYSEQGDNLKALLAQLAGGQ